MSSGDVLEALCRGLKASDPKAFEGLFRLLRDDLLRYVQSIVRGGPEAHDLVQDVFVSLWGLRETLDPSQPIKAYLYRMARNRAYRHLRDERSHAQKHDLIRQRLDGAAGAPGLDAVLDADLLGARLQTWIQELPERQREVLVLSRYHELSHREIAAVMGISPRTVNNHLMRALEHLQRCIHAFEPALLAR
jgi:RNA polymerase sigma-70 factor (ECF subfamily)